MKPKRSRLFHVAQVGAWVAIAVALVFLVRGLDFAALAAALRRASWTLVGVVIALNFLSAFCRVGYWWLVLTPLGSFSLREVVRLTFAALAGNCIAPARAGDVLKIWQLKRLFGVDVSASVAALGFEKIGEVFAMFSLLLPLPWLLPTLPGHLQAALKLLPLALPVAAALVWLGFRRGLRYFDRAGTRWLAGLSLLRSPTRIALACACFLAIWALDVGEIRLLMVALDIRGGFGAALFVLLTVNLAIALPLSPGNVGTHELGSMAALDVYGVPTSRAFAFSLLYHATQTLPIVLAGLPSLRALLAGRRLAEVQA